MIRMTSDYTWDDSKCTERACSNIDQNVNTQTGAEPADTSGHTSSKQEDLGWIAELWDEPQGRDDTIRPTQHSPQVVGNVRAMRVKLTLRLHESTNTYRIFEKISRSQSQQEKRISLPSNKLSIKLLIHTLSVPSGTTEYLVQYRLNLSYFHSFSSMSITLQPRDLFLVHKKKKSKTHF